MICISLRADWCQAPLKNPISKLQALFSQINKEMIYFLTWNQKRCWTDRHLDNHFLILLFSSFFFMCHQEIYSQISWTNIMEMFPLLLNCDPLCRLCHRILYSFGTFAWNRLIYFIYKVHVSQIYMCANQ